MALAAFNRVCGLISGGAKDLYITEAANVTSMTITSGVVTAITMEADKYFNKYEFEQDSCEIKEDISIENNCMKVTHGLEFYLTKMSATTRTAVNEVALASACGIIAIATDANGTKWVLGYSNNFGKERPLEMKTTKGTSGKKLTDANGYTVTMESEDNEPMCSCTASIPVYVAP